MTAEPLRARRSVDAAPWLCLAGGLLATLWVAVPRAWLVADRFTLPKGLLFHAAALLTGVACLAVPRRWRLDEVDLAGLAFAGLGALSALVVAHNKWLALGALGVTLSGTLLFLAARVVAGEGRREELLLTVAVGVGVLALSVVLEAYGLLDGLSPEKRAPGGLLGHRNRAAHLLVLALPVLWRGLARARSWRTLGLHLGTVALMGTAITLSRSRAAWLAMGVLAVLLLVAWVTGRTRAAGARWHTVALVAALLGGAGVALVAPDALSWRGSYADTLRRVGEHDAGSGRGRLIQYTNTLHMVAGAPLLGVGPGNWTVQYPRFATPGDPSYSEGALVPVDALPQADWVGLLAERGVLALLVLAAAGALLLLGAWKRIHDGETDETRRDGWTLLAVLIALVVLGALDTVLLTPPATFLVAVVVGALASARREQVTLSFEAGRRQMAMAGVVLLTACPLAYGAVRGQARQLVYQEPRSAERYARAARLDPGAYEARVLLGDSEVRQGRCEQGLAILREANHLFPHAKAPMMAWAPCHPESRKAASHAAPTVMDVPER
ncbi:O-antigen ligase family protein [Pyxidicoccus sp. MSG2]|uniref:O-antigen ligase family protein n=1 Tax=Pyxidicoccus sp. MSG2 TaxID=2996790 RepID=UPI00227154F7|nr:O-antigen ligase family protein [Pyxidicoccus sp. MSG2]MCY1019670.1 O-antigen ligase family protein [Pyxidicoccus sp. MSG2]